MLCRWNDCIQESYSFDRHGSADKARFTIENNARMRDVEGFNDGRS